MKILFISQYYPPEIGAASNRIGYFAGFLAASGHEVSVLTSCPSYPGERPYEGYKNKFNLKIEDAVKVYRTRIFLSAKKNALGRLAHYLSFVISSVIKRKKIEKPDVIIATSPPLFTAITGVIFKKLWQVPLMTDIRDIWPESVESVGAVKNKALLAQGSKLAIWIYKNSDRISATSPGIKKKILQASHSSNVKISIFPNGAELDLFNSQTQQQKNLSAQIRHRYGIGEKFLVLYTGNLGLAQAPEIFVKAARLLSENPDVVFLIVGEGVLRRKIEQDAKDRNLTNIIFTGPLPRSDMPAFISSADVCVIPYKKSDTFKNTLPSKMFDYMAGAKPLIINLDGEAAELIKQAGCGIITREESASSLLDAILYLKKNPDVAAEMGEKGREFVEKNYRREIIAGQLENELKTLSADSMSSKPV